MSVQSADLLIIGGGCTGCSTALQAARLDHSLRIVLVEGLYVAAGFSGHGFKLSPAVGRRMAEFIVTGRKPKDLIFEGSRFSEGRGLAGKYESNIIPWMQAKNIGVDYC